MRKFTLSAAAALTSMLTILTCPAYTYASSDHDFEDKNTDTGYQLIIDDEADFLTSDEEESLSEVMYETAGYCNAMVVTTTYHTFSSTEDEQRSDHYLLPVRPRRQRRSSNCQI